MMASSMAWTGAAARGAACGAGRAAERSGGIDFERLVGREGWRRLPEAVRRRFAHVLAPGEVVNFAGMMGVVTCSPVGFALAQLARLFGTPFAPWAGRGVPVVIRLSNDERTGGVAWDREYRYSGRAPILVRSIKCVTPDGRLLECVGGGFGMRLQVYEEDRALHFRSLRYFWRLGRLYLPLPHAVSPGIAHVVHEDLGRGRFRFVMTFRHRLLGTLFFQDGEFQDEGEVS